jgi:SAM-dependent methyltransferase
VSEADFLVTVRASYDTVATDYGERFRGELATKPLDRGFLTGFAELVKTGVDGRIADVGCGTGQVTAFLHSLGLEVVGIDLSPGMVAMARKWHPEVHFIEGTMTDLNLADGSVAAVNAYYSTIHIPNDRLPGVFAEFHRVLVPGGYVMLALQAGDGPRRCTEAFGHKVVLDYYWRSPEEVAELLCGAGLPVIARLQREPDGMELEPRVFLLARKAREDTEV